LSYGIRESLRQEVRPIRPGFSTAEPEVLVRKEAPLDDGVGALLTPYAEGPPHRGLPRRQPVVCGNFRIEGAKLLVQQGQAQPQPLRSCPSHDLHCLTFMCVTVSQVTTSF
jgi:hypothetical protein